MKDRSLIAAFSGVILEAYNNALYGFFVVSLSSLFFPPTFFVSPIIASFGSFAAGYITRPLGGMLFGFIGDKYGRRIALQFTILLTAIPTFVIGMLPSYDSIGIISPFILILCRLLQGFGTSSDYTGVIIYVAEQRGKHNKVLLMCFLVSCGFFGALLGVLISFLLTSSMSPAWGWRLSFVVGGILSLIVYFLRLKMKETPAFEEINKLPKNNTNPLMTILKQDIVKLLACCVFGGANLVPAYLATVYINAELKERLGFSLSQILFNNFCILLVGAILVLCCAKLIARFGESFVMKCSLYWFIFLSVPVYLWAIAVSSVFSFIVLQLFFILGDAPLIAALAIYLPKLFLTHRRFSGVGFSYALGQALLGGTTPIIAVFFINMTGHPWAPSYLLCLTSFLFLISIINTENRLVSEGG